MKAMMICPPVSIVFAEDDEFISYFVEDFVPMLPKKDLREVQHKQSFGEDSGISQYCKSSIALIRDNNDDLIEFLLGFEDGRKFSDLAWQLLGRYIANNTHLKKVDLEGSGLNDAKMSALFRGLTKSNSIYILDLMENNFGLDGVRCMIPFLENSPQLNSLLFGRNANINTECFELLVRTLNGIDRSGEDLYFSGCNIEDISALKVYALPHLRNLYLRGNNIGRDGCMVIANLLQQKGSMLTNLDLRDIGMGDDEAESIATSLKHNTKLKTLELEDNTITQRGCRAFLTLLNDVSSIETTYASNHSLMSLGLPSSDETTCMRLLINSALADNSRNGYYREDNLKANAICRSKVIRSQLNSQVRKELCHLQGIEYSSSNIFADIEPNLLPRILALIWENHGQSELYTALVPMAPDLMSFVDSKAMMQEMMKKKAAQISILAAEAAALRERVAIRELGDSKHAVASGEGV